VKFHPETKDYTQFHSETKAACSFTQRDGHSEDSNKTVQSLSPPGPDPGDHVLWPYRLAVDTGPAAVVLICTVLPRSRPLSSDRHGSHRTGIEFAPRIPGTAKPIAIFCSLFDDAVSSVGRIVSWECGEGSGRDLI
jgi:hypothetical protein